MQLRVREHNLYSLTALLLSAQNVVGAPGVVDLRLDALHREGFTELGQFAGVNALRSNALCIILYGAQSNTSLFLW